MGEQNGWIFTQISMCLHPIIVASAILPVGYSLKFRCVYTLQGKVDKVEGLDIHSNFDVFTPKRAFLNVLRGLDIHSNFDVFTP